LSGPSPGREVFCCRGERLDGQWRSHPMQARMTPQTEGTDRRRDAFARAMISILLWNGHVV
jgi:hypothetical protein